MLGLLATSIRPVSFLLPLGLLCAAAACSPAEPPSTDPSPSVDAQHSNHAALTAGWAVYTIPVGAHSASVRDASPGSPLAWFTRVSGRDYQFRFNPSARYVLTRPTQPEDQLDWNKLPGVSDCGTLDLSQDGAMFGWRWRIDTTPKVLEVTAYANNRGKHLWPAAPLFTLDAEDLTSDTPLRYRVWIDGAQYRFAVSGTVRGRSIAVTTTLPRACSGSAPTTLKWASGLYFGGTSTAPSVITGAVSEIDFRP